MIYFFPVSTYNHLLSAHFSSPILLAQAVDYGWLSFTDYFPFPKVLLAKCIYFLNLAFSGCLAKTELWPSWLILTISLTPLYRF